MDNVQDKNYNFEKMLKGFLKDSKTKQRDIKKYHKSNQEIKKEREKKREKHNSKS
ncbi:hypothetical protein AAK964_12215 [Tissierella praeacuta]|uniref:hypothetical protein n=1 Tax=Tissierella praeacuta TaxID=43131 RepID=UPI003513EB14